MSDETRTGGGQGEPPQPSGSYSRPPAGDPPPVVTRPTKSVTRARRRVDRSIRLLVVADLVLVVALVGLFGIALVRTLPSAGHPAQGSPSPSVSPSPGLMTMGLAHIPTNSPCILCHESGGSAALKVIPAVAHPLEGWRQCTTCHTDQDLGLKAPGHEGIAETECLKCHKEAVEGPAITQPHATLQDQHCLDCHGSVAHLPSTMASMNESSCTWCHKPTTLPPPEYPHAPNLGKSCRECHQSPQTGNLPIDHALYPDSSCLLCHLIKTASPSPTAGGPSPASPVASPASSPTASSVP